MNGLERRYRRLMRLYPAWYRAQREEEMVGMLLDGAGPDQRRPGLGEACGLVVHGLETRFDLAEGGALGRWAGQAASPSLGAAAALSLAALIFGELVPGPGYWVPVARFGPFLTVGWVCYLAWIIAALIDMGTASRWQRPATAAAVAVTVLTVPVGDAVAAGRPPLFILAALISLGLPALVRPEWTRSRPELRPVMVAVAATVAILTATGVAAGLTQPYQWPLNIAQVGFYQIWLTVLAAWAPVAVAGALAAAAVLSVAKQRSLAVALAVATLPWLVISIGHAPRHSTELVSAAVLGLIVAATGTRGAANQARLNHREPPQPNPATTT